MQSCPFFHHAAPATAFTRVRTLFADDHWANWVSLVLHVLENFCLEVISQNRSPDSTRGPPSDAALARFHEQAGVTYLCATVHARTCGVPIRTQDEYLGSVVIRKSMTSMCPSEFSCHPKYLDIKRALHGKHILSTTYRAKPPVSAFYEPTFCHGTLVHSGSHKRAPVPSRH